MPNASLVAYLELAVILALVAALLATIVRLDVKATARVNRWIGLDRFGVWSRGQPWPVRAGIVAVLLLALVAMLAAKLISQAPH